MGPYGSAPSAGPGANGLPSGSPGLYGPSSGEMGPYGSAPPPGPGMYGAPQLDQRGQYHYPLPVGPYGTGHSPGPARRSRATWQFIAVGVAIGVIVGAAATYTLTRGQGQHSHNTAAGGAVTSSPSANARPGTGPAGPAGPATAPPVVGGDGNVAAPERIDSLYFNPVLTRKYITNKLKNQISYDFGSFPSGVVGGFYTSNPAAKTTSRNYQLLFDVAYLAGAGHPNVAIKSFLANRTLRSPVEIPAGAMGGRAGCSWLHVTSGTIAHCMWADKNTYADFYAWRSSPAALARAMLAARPEIELSGGLRGAVPQGMRAGSGSPGSPSA